MPALRSVSSGVVMGSGGAGERVDSSAGAIQPTTARNFSRQSGQKSGTREGGVGSDIISHRPFARAGTAFGVEDPKPMRPSLGRTTLASATATPLVVRHPYCRRAHRSLRSLRAGRWDLEVRRAAQT